MGEGGPHWPTSPSTPELEVMPPSKESGSGTGGESLEMRGEENVILRRQENIVEPFMPDTGLPHLPGESLESQWARREKEKRNGTRLKGGGGKVPFGGGG